jgi:hypothetical protein
MDPRLTQNIKVFDGVTIAASGADTSETQDVSRSVGYQSLQYTITGSGTVTFTFEVSNDGVTFSTPSGASAIGTTLGAGSDVLPIEMTTLARYIRIIATEVGGSSSVTINAWLAIQ